MKRVESTPATPGNHLETRTEDCSQTAADGRSSHEWSRREFIKGASTLVTTLPIAGALSACGDELSGEDFAPDDALLRTDSLPAPAAQLSIKLNVNGTVYPLQIEPRVTLNTALRDLIGLTGTKLGCDRAACGACTVQIDGVPTLSCTTLAVEADGRAVTTIEGLASGDALHPIQTAFIECDALQCGFCTAGMLMSCKSLLDRNPSPTEDDVRVATAGNLCRCGTYPHVFKATLQAADAMKGG